MGNKESGSESLNLIEVELEAVEEQIKSLSDKIGKNGYCADYHLERAIKKHKERAEAIRKQIARKD